MRKRERIVLRSCDLPNESVEQRARKPKIGKIECRLCRVPILHVSLHLSLSFQFRGIRSLDAILTLTYFFQESGGEKKEGVVQPIHQ